MSRYSQLALLLLASCTQSSSLGDDPPANDPPAMRPDASTTTPPPPSFPDAGVVHDAAVATGDACVPQVKQLLVNPAFDEAPQGKGWQQQLIVADSPLITGEDGVPEHTAPNKAWLGGFEASLTTVKDSIVQNVAIPANTTHLVLTGFYDVRTAELDNTVEYDTAKLVITEVDGTVIETVLALSNKTAKTSWTMFGHAITQNLSGKTVRVRLTSTNDSLDPTSFYFDSLALTATFGCATLN